MCNCSILINHGSAVAITVVAVLGPEKSFIQREMNGYPFTIGTPVLIVIILFLVFPNRVIFLKQSKNPVFKASEVWTAVGEHSPQSQRPYLYKK